MKGKLRKITIEKAMLRLLAVLALIPPAFAQTPKQIKTTLRIVVVVLGVFVVTTFLRYIAEERLSMTSAPQIKTEY